MPFAKIEHRLAALIPHRDGVRIRGRREDITRSQLAEEEQYDRSRPIRGATSAWIRGQLRGRVPSIARLREIQPERRINVGAQLVRVSKVLCRGGELPGHEV